MKTGIMVIISDNWIKKSELKLQISNDVFIIFISAKGYLN